MGGWYRCGDFVGASFPPGRACHQFFLGSDRWAHCITWLLGWPTLQGHLCRSSAVGTPRHHWANTAGKTGAGQEPVNLGVEGRFLGGTSVSLGVVAAEAERRASAGSLRAGRRSDRVLVLFLRGAGLSSSLEGPSRSSSVRTGLKGSWFHWFGGSHSGENFAFQHSKAPAGNAS